MLIQLVKTSPILSRIVFNVNERDRVSHLSLVFGIDVDTRNILVTADRKKAYIRYCVFSWGVPFVVVAICVTLQLTKMGNVGYGKYGGNKSEKAASYCAETDSYHGDHVDAGICTGFLLNSLFGISIRHTQQVSRCAHLPVLCIQEARHHHV